MRRKLLLTLLVATLMVAACSTQTVDVVFETNTPVPSPSPTQFQGVDPYGTGIDGPLEVIAGSITRINVCHSLTRVVDDTLILGSTASFDPGEVLLLLQDRDDAAVPPPGRAGQFELVRLASVGVTSALALFPTLHSYETGLTARAQACTVPEYTDVTIADGGILAGAERPTDIEGGVLALLVSSTLTIGNASKSGGLVSADELGFPGGACELNGDTTDSTLPDDAQGGKKGSGLLGGGAPSGRGHRANGGGGGNPFLAGGGGGGGFGAGGRGGNSNNEAADAFGEGGEGIAITGSAARLFLGGGGGGGHSKGLEASPCDGGAGGGIVFIQARKAAGGGQVRAAGAYLAEAVVATDSGGGGGGGGGGTVWLVVGTGDSFSPSVSVAGGHGGGGAQLPLPNGAGPGGGGGGGRVRAQGFDAVDLLRNGGEPGAIPGTDGTRGALTGSTGATF